MVKKYFSTQQTLELNGLFKHYTTQQDGETGQVSTINH